MTREEYVKYLQIVKACYPNFVPESGNGSQNEKLKNYVGETYMVFADIEYQLANAGLQQYMAENTSAYAPMPGQMRGICIRLRNKIQSEPDKEETEAWAECKKAIRNSLWHAEESFEKLSPLVQETVGSPEWLREMGLSESGSVDTVTQASFLRTYRSVKKRHEEKKNLPASVQKLLPERKKESLSTPLLSVRDEMKQIMARSTPMPESAKARLIELGLA